MGSQRGPQPAPGLAGSGWGHQDVIAANLELSLAPIATAPARARAAVSEWLQPHCSDAVVFEVAQLLTSELVTNAVRHASLRAGQALHLRARMEEAVVHLEVWDGGTEGTVARRHPDRNEAVGGFGLELVARLAGDWGVERDARGTTVWLDLPVRVEATA